MEPDPADRQPGATRAGFHFPRIDGVPGRFVLAIAAAWLAVQVSSLALSLLGHSDQAYLYRAFLTLKLDGADSWGAMRIAHDWLLTGQSGSVYQAVFFEQKVKFQYPLTSLLIYPPAGMLGLDDTVRAFNLANWAAVVAQGALTGAIVHALLGRHTGPGERQARLLAGAAAALVTITFCPVLRAFNLGQVQPWINAAFLLAALAWLHGRFTVAGAAIGLACLFKPQFGLFLLWAVLRGNGRFATGFVMIVLPAGLAALALFGLENNLDYLRVLATISRHGEVFIANQSVNGLANRLLSGVDGHVWSDDTFAPYHPVVHALTVATSLVLAAYGLMFNRRTDPQGLQPFLLAGLAFTLASPVAWEHHFGFVPVIVSALLIDEIAKARGHRWPGIRLAALLLCYVVVAQDLFEVAMRFMPSDSLASSSFFLAVLMVFALLASTNRFARLRRQVVGDTRSPDQQAGIEQQLHERPSNSASTSSAPMRSKSSDTRN